VLSKIRNCIAFISAMIAVQAAAQDDEVSQVSSDNAIAIERAIELGETIYLHDQTAWHTTDALREEFNDLAATGIRGWIVNEVEGGQEAVFYRPTTNGLEAVWSGVYDGGAVRDRRSYDAGERVLSAAEAAMAMAAGAPFSTDFSYTSCSDDPFNRVVVPTGNADGGFFVYFLVPQPAIDQIPFGGHYRFEVVDGKVVKHRAFTKSCITLGNGSANPDEELSAIYITHSLDPVPTEVHVFSMFAAGVPVIVSTTGNDRTWQVFSEDGQTKIEAIE